MNNEENNNNISSNSFMVDDQKLSRIIKKIITLENDNVKTRELNDEDIKKRIEKIIEEEVKCC